MRSPQLLSSLACLATAACWSTHYHDLPEETEPLPTGRTERTYYGGLGDEEVLRMEWHILTWPDGRVQKDGVEREWYPSGELRAERHYRRNRPSGVWKNWYESGVPRSEIEFGDGVESGTMRFWYEDGTVSAEGRGIGGVKEGPWTHWFEAGVMSHRGEYAGSRRTGTWSFWDRKGRLREEGRYQDGLRVGEWEFFDEDGNVTIKEFDPAASSWEGAQRSSLRTTNRGDGTGAAVPSGSRPYPR